jgi:PIN domain nuclease of toxin-antitoxin system
VTLLLDSQVLLWWREGSRKLGPRARAAISQDAFGVVVSAASAWELTIKSATGKLTLREPVERWLPAALDGSGFDALPVTVTHALAVTSLPFHHADPFDRLLIAQAQVEKLTIVTADTAFDNYDVRVLDARR